MTTFFLCFPVLFSLSLSFLLHTFKKHIHSFLGLATTFFNNATDNYKLHLKHHHPISSTATTHVTPPSPIGLADDIGGGVDVGFMCCTESLGFESIDERKVDDHIDEIHDNNNNIDEDEDDDGCWRRRRVAEGRRNWREMKSFPPPISWLNQNFQPSFFLLPVRKNGRLELTEVRIKRPETLYASRQDGRLRLYLVPDHCIQDEEECEGEEEEEELVEDVAEQPEEEIIVESAEDEVVEEEIRYEKEEDRVGEWKFPMRGNDGFRRCHQVVDQCYHIHATHHHHHMFGIGIA